MRKNTVISFIGLLFCLCIQAQGTSTSVNSTVNDVDWARAEKFSSDALEQYIKGKRPYPNWIEGSSYFYYNVKEDNGVSYYCNLASPVVLDKEALKYIDYDLDVKVFPNGEKRLLDVDEYEEHGKKWSYSPQTDKILKHNVRILVDWINNRKGPFSKEYVEIWYNRYLELSRRQ